jgi:hypothetical protein
MILTFSNNFNIIDEYCHSYSGFLQGTAANSILLCKRYSSNQIIIEGYTTLSSSATLSMSLYLQIGDLNTSPNASANVYTQSVNIMAYSSTNAIIINANTNTLTVTLAQSGSLSLGLSGTMTQPYLVGNSFPLYIVFKLTLNTLTSANSAYIQVDLGNWVLDTAASGQQIFKYQLSGTNYWVPSAATLVSGNIYKVPVYNNYSMNVNT